MKLNYIYEGNALEVLKTFPSNSIDMSISSPPYWKSRNYGNVNSTFDEHPECDHVFKKYKVTGMSGGKKSKKVKIKNSDNFQITEDTTYSKCIKCGAWTGELGWEKTPAEFINHLILIFNEVYRVIKPEGSCWVNIGDKYQSKLYGTNQMLCQVLLNLDLLLIILLFFTKQKKYYFKQQFEPMKTETTSKIKFGGNKAEGYGVGTYSGNEWDGTDQTERNKRCVWSINTRGTGYKHFAAYPQELIEIPINTSCPKGGIVLDPFFGIGTTGVEANRQRKKFIGIDKQPDYIKLAWHNLENNGYSRRPL